MYDYPTLEETIAWVVMGILVITPFIICGVQMAYEEFRKFVNAITVHDPMETR